MQIASLGGATGATSGMMTAHHVARKLAHGSFRRPLPTPGLAGISEMPPLFIGVPRARPALQKAKDCCPRGMQAGRPAAAACHAAITFLILKAVARSGSEEPGDPSLRQYPRAQGQSDSPAGAPVPTQPPGRSPADQRIRASAQPHQPRHSSRGRSPGRPAGLGRPGDGG
jgi:hypothetical protein